LTTFEWPTKILTTPSWSLSCTDPNINFNAETHLGAEVMSSFVFQLTNIA